MNMNLLDYQQRVWKWMREVFNETIASDPVERNHRFLEEALELVQACDCTKADAHALVEYVYGRPKGEKWQEVGGALHTLVALADAQGLQVWECALREEKRVSDPEVMTRIRFKQAAKPKFGPLPQAVPDSPLLVDLRLAAETLRTYEMYHRAKNTAESLEKAEVNAALAARFENTIAASQE